MLTDTLLGRDGCGSDEILTEYLLRAGRLVERCTYNGRERPGDPAAAVAELERRAAISRRQADTCELQGVGAGDYPDRARACEAAAHAVRQAFAAVGGPG